MVLRVSRLPAAAILTAAAVVVPCTAWFVVGSRGAEREAAAIREEPIADARRETEALAQRLSGRLEGMRADESWRPFYHYQSSYHDPTSSCLCASVTPSPLAQGLRDPLIETHFQVDPSQALTMPSLHGDWPEVVTRDWLAEQQAILARLSGAAGSCLAVFDIVPTAASAERPDAFHVEPDDPKVQVGEFVWRSLRITDQTALVGLRRVETSRGPLVQGFLVDLDAVEAWLQPTSSPTRFLPVDEVGERLHAILDLPDIQWCVAADPTEASHLAAERADRLLADFGQSFAFGSGSAALAAAVVLFLLWQADRLAQQRSRFAASAAHELRTPLASLRLYGEMLQDPTLGDPAKRDEYARRVAEEAERLGRVVTNVLSFTRLERGALSVQCRPGNLDLAVRDCVERLRPLVEARGAQLEYISGADLPQVAFDPEAVHQILQNLVDNAEKYGRSDDHRIEVTTERSDDGIRLAVRDFGPGVPAWLGDRVFQAFQRGDTDDAPAGLGLGLALVSSLARAQGAQAGVESPAGGGARFTVDFTA